MKDTVCPKCGSSSIYRDDDYRYNMQIIACLICGWRIYRHKLVKYRKIKRHKYERKRAQI